VSASFTETPDQRRARYARLAIAAAAAAARTQIPEVRTAYLLLAESWSNLAKADRLPGDADLPDAMPEGPNPLAKREETGNDAHT